MSRRPAVITFGLDAEAVPAVPWLWHGMLAPGKVTLLTSLWKSGKTTLLAHLLARRRPQDPPTVPAAGNAEPGCEFLDLAVAPGTSLVISEEPADLWPERRRRHDLGAELG